MYYIDARYNENNIPKKYQHLFDMLRQNKSVDLYDAYGRPSYEKEKIWSDICREYNFHDGHIKEPTILTHNCSYFTAGYIYSYGTDNLEEIVVYRIFTPTKTIEIEILDN